MTVEEILARGRPAILIERHLGGLGDLVCMREAVRSLTERHADWDLIAHVPSWYFPLFEDLATELLPYDANDLPIMWPQSLDLSAKRRQPLLAFQLFCPCGIHEEERRFRPTRNRIQNFADALGVKPRCPDLRPLLRRWGKRRPRARKRLLVGMQPWSMNHSKDWPVLRWQALVKLLQMAGFARVRVYDARKRDWRMEGVEHVKAAGCRELIESVAECDLMIAPDSGCMHVAGALDIPTVALFGPTDGRLTCKYYESVRVIEKRRRRKCRQPCYYNGEHNRYYCERGPEQPRIGDCMLAIETVDVYHAVLDTLREERRLAV